MQNIKELNKYSELEKCWKTWKVLENSKNVGKVENCEDVLKNVKKQRWKAKKCWKPQNCVPNIRTKLKILN